MPCAMKHLMWVQVLITSQQLYSDKFVPFKADFRTIFITSGMRDSLKYPAEETPSWMESGIKEMRINSVTKGAVSTWNQ